MFYVVDGNWSPWSTGDCSASCGGGTLKRTRTCSDPKPQYNGKDCPGDAEDEEKCNEKACPGEAI